MDFEGGGARGRAIAPLAGAATVGRAGGGVAVSGRAGAGVLTLGRLLGGVAGVVGARGADEVGVLARVRVGAREAGRTGALTGKTIY